MTTKLFELRDRATFIPVAVIKIDPANEAERYLLRRAGYNTLPSDLVIMVGLCGGIGQATCDPHDWTANGTRTRFVAHEYIAIHFDDLETGAVIDVEFLVGETKEAKISERITHP